MPKKKMFKFRPQRDEWQEIDQRQPEQKKILNKTMNQCSECLRGKNRRKDDEESKKKERQKQIIATQPWICCCEFQENRELFPISHLMRRCRRNYRECWFDFREFCWEKLHELPWCCVCWLLRSKSKQLLQSDTKCLHEISNSKSFQ